MSIYILNNKDQIVYDKIYEAVSLHRTSVSIPDIPNATVIDIYNKVISENREGYYYSVGSVTKLKSLFGTTIQLNIYKNNDSTIRNRIKDEMKKIIFTVSCTDDEYSKIRKVYRYFVENYQYARRDSLDYHQFCSPAIYKEAVCEGFSLFFSQIMNYIGISCGIITGSSKMNGIERPHAWNVIFYNNNYYHLDVTWDICTKEKGRAFFDYFMLDDDMINNDHFWDDYSIPRCKDSLQEYYKKRCCFCKNNQDIKKFICKNIKNRNDLFGFRVEQETDGFIIDDKYIENLITEINKDSNIFYRELKYFFNPYARTIIFSILF